MLFTGKGKEPKRFKTGEELINYVKNNAGYIGYVSSSVNTDGINVIPIK